ncbi:hypothetical protein CAOG_04140 [Capsaspora owczarzaki ATCC 30864]|uniref:FAD dependent oxidoreductase domain-containing protein n=1 Tax=Capsaspora owczarzaki (strain ATCC 30864) TaxID=595528 RepID=A0A0D2X2X8_CAPO3|nr:hypothetical protein CAOG_04140 [Capsaspora owczarzaki ATCC 30864]KJE93334.1 hypothetical protein CAOG_004140 [Capsaspora owczarzaki ATCC 30864]|eukprot:XP_004347965.1 hypothetical protein CAOG_04140 [Capsaspora owczarzaki ATCC 30864]
MSAIVIGAGVNGLTCAVRLLEDGWKVTVVAKNFSPSTTSDGAAGFWFPYFAQPLDKIVRWSSETLSRWQYLATHDSAATGCEFSEGYILYEKETHGPEGPYWTVFNIPQRKLTSAELPAGMSEGWLITAVVTQTHKHLLYLQERIKALGGTFECKTLSSVYDVVGRGDVVINCAGLEAYSLVPDPNVYPIRGQVTYLTTTPESPVNKFYIVEDQVDNVTYIFPRQDRIVIGGTTHKGQWDTHVDMKVAADIRHRCAQLAPGINDTSMHKVMGHFVGLRPGRTEVRLEKELKNGFPLIHNYGHGGCGWTVSYGCAADVVELARPHKPGRALSKL